MLSYKVLCKILSSKLVLTECLVQRWYSRHGDLSRRSGETSMSIHLPQCIETNVEGTDGTSEWGVARAAAESGRSKVYLPDS